MSSDQGIPRAMNTWTALRMGRPSAPLPVHADQGARPLPRLRRIGPHDPRQKPTTSIPPRQCQAQHGHREAFGQTLSSLICSESIQTPKRNQNEHPSETSATIQHRRRSRAVKSEDSAAKTGFSSRALGPQCATNHCSRWALHSGKPMSRHFVVRPLSEFRYVAFASCPHSSSAAGKPLFCGKTSRQAYPRVLK